MSAGIFVGVAEVHQQKQNSISTLTYTILKKQSQNAFQWIKVFLSFFKLFDKRKVTKRLILITHFLRTKTLSEIGKLPL